MKKIIKTLFYLFCISTLSFAEEEIENTRDRGIDKMNFYIPVNKQNKYSNFTELDIRKDKNETLVPSNQAINRLYHEDLIPKNCRVRTTLGYYTYISQTENQVLIPTWNVEISDKDGQISNYYVDAINLNVLNRKGHSS